MASFRLSHTGAAPWGLRQVTQLGGTSPFAEWKLQEAVNAQREDRGQRVRQRDIAEGLKAMVTAGLDGVGCPQAPAGSSYPKSHVECGDAGGKEVLIWGFGACGGGDPGYSAAFPLCTYALTVALRWAGQPGAYGSSEFVFP